MNATQLYVIKIMALLMVLAQELSNCSAGDSFAVTAQRCVPRAYLLLMNCNADKHRLDKNYLILLLTDNVIK